MASQEKEGFTEEDAKNFGAVVAWLLSNGREPDGRIREETGHVIAALLSAPPNRVAMLALAIKADTDKRWADCRAPARSG